MGGVFVPEVKVVFQCQKVNTTSLSLSAILDMILQQQHLKLCVRLAVTSEWFRIHVCNIQGDVTVTVGCDVMTRNESSRVSFRMN